MRGASVKPCDDPELPQGVKGGGHRAGEASDLSAADSAKERRLDQKIRSELHVSFLRDSRRTGLVPHWLLFTQASAFRELHQLYLVASMLAWIT